MLKSLQSTFGDLIPRGYKKGESHPADQLTLQNGKLHQEWAKLLDIRASIEYKVFDAEAGALFNWRNPEGRPTFVFGFEIKGTHVYDLVRNLAGLYDNWVEGLRSIPAYQTWKLHVGSDASSQARTEELTDLVLSNEDNPGIVQTLCGEMARMQELTREGKRADRFIRLYVYYWGSRDRLQGDSEDVIESGIREVIDFVDDLKAMMSGRKKKADAQKIEAIFRQSYEQGFQTTINLLQGTFGMGIRAMTHDEIWANLRRRFSNEPAGKSPYKIICQIDRSGVLLTEDRQEQHIGNALAKDYPPTLTTHGVQIKKWDYERGEYREDFIAVLEARQKFKGWAHEFHQAKGLWDCFAIETLSGIEFFIEMSTGSAKAQTENAQDLHRQAVRKQSEAAKRGEWSAYADETLRDAKQMMGDFFGGDRPLRIAFVALVHADSTPALDLKCRDFLTRFKLSPLERETSCAGRVWLQTLPAFEEHLLQIKIKILSMGYPMPPIGVDFRHYYSTKQAIGLLPWATTQPNDLRGLEYISLDRQPILLDIFSPEKAVNWLCTAIARYGKSYTGHDITDCALAWSQPVTYIDQPPEDGSSALKDRCLIMGGVYINVDDESFNILGIPKALLSASSRLTETQRTNRFKTLQGFWLECLMILGGPTESEQHLAQVTRDLLALAIDIYVNDPDIQRRYVAAVESGIGSIEWSQTPTLKDFVKYTKRYKLQHHLARIQGAVDEALDLLDLRLSRKADPTTVIGAAISRPSTVDVEAVLFSVFSLKGLQAGSEESQAYCLSAYVNAIQKALSHPISHVIVEEAQYFADFPGVLKIISDIATRGNQQGIRLGIITNSFDKVAQTQAGRDLINNLPIKIIGGIQPGTVERLSDCLKIPHEMLEKCTEFVTNRQQGYTTWMLQINQKHYIARRFPSWFSSSLAASFKFERDVRNTFFETIDDKQLAIAAFCYWFRKCSEAGKTVQPLEKAQIKEIAKLCSAQ
jgi:hypothetical protein